ncbi:hypothetical protein CDV31_016428 [Fusarium ambrosium]|uniref:Heterokaryon incompatibility domain-containing protein n=1 Tax=Fusarium ambrosium TaxID=131363 RepID=A0A428S8S2_9HYPO|nr:hypothetical protein CDV31_016428 [Fusarium ambrosium]
MSSRTEDDLGDTLAEILSRKTTSIVDQLLDIQKYTIGEPKVRRFIRKLECFKLEPFDPDKHGISPTKKQINGIPALCSKPEVALRRCPVDAYDSDPENDYVAISYTWKRCESEEHAQGSYLIEDRPEEYDLSNLRSKRPRQGQFQPSTVRDCVFRRVLGFMQHRGVDLLWIDAYSVNQGNDNEKQIGVQAMHLVYSYSKHPVALLARPIESNRELEVLFEIMNGLILREEGSKVLSEVGTTSYKVFCRQKAWKAMQLLESMTKDRWWTRAWTFQENYRGLRTMTLLIPYTQEVSLQARHQQSFERIEGDLCVRSWTLLTEATKLCQAYRDLNPLHEGEKKTIDGILSAMGKYAGRLRKDEPMYPTIISDIAKRGTEFPWDRLDIIANTCWYPVSLNTLALRKSNFSLSLSILAQCLLNGEVMVDGHTESDATLDGKPFDCTVIDFIYKCSLRRYISLRTKGSLTYNRGCRYPNVTFRREGLQTWGHLWKLGPILDYQTICSYSVSDKPEDRWLSQTERRDLIGLRNVLNDRYGREAERLLNQLDELLDIAFDMGESKDIKSLPFKLEHPLRMATELVTRAREGSKLRLAELWDPHASGSPPNRRKYRAVFLHEDEGPGGRAQSGPCGATEAYIFTALDYVPPQTEKNRVDNNRHVSMKVEVAGSALVLAKEPTTPLLIKGWTLGFCDFTYCERESVLFRWPRVFEDVYI